MARPSKPVAVLQQEKKSHRTKAELEARRKAEEAFTTGETMREKPETRKNATAHKEFLRMKKLLVKIGKFDAIYENIINRYCMLYAESGELEEKKEHIALALEELEQDKKTMIQEGCTIEKYWKMRENMERHSLEIDRQIQGKRKMMMDIEKENAMTLASALRNVPKKEEGEKNPLLEVLQSG